MVKAAIAHYRQHLKHRLVSIPWFWLGLVALLLVSATLRFWGLSRFNNLVFDEVYYARYGNDYLTQTPFFDVHPPLGKYLIGIGIWLSRLNPWGYSVQTSVDGFNLPTFSYRWLNALTGSLIPLVVVAIAYHLTHRRRFALIAGLFAAADGLLLVESRYALINVYLIGFGLLGQLFFLMALEKPKQRPTPWLTLAGICFGASASVKWNGLAFLLSAYLLIAAGWGVYALQRLRHRPSVDPTGITVEPLLETGTAAGFRTPLANLTQLRILDLLFNLAMIPALFYRLIWIPHLRISQEFDFWGVQKQIIGYNIHMGAGADVHPYCSSWYTWPWMMRPVGYFYRQVEHPAEAAGMSVSTPTTQTIYDVHAMGNPILWWLSTLAILLLTGALLHYFWRWFTQTVIQQTPLSLSSEQITHRWVTAYLLLNYLANFLPWIKVTRCAFIYHYMGASIFAFLAIAWVVDRQLRSYHLFSRIVGVTAVLMVLAGFVFWLPLYLGLPLSPEAFRSRMWFESWY